MASSSKSKSRHHIRSISLPSRSHPTTLRIEEKLNKLKTWESSSMPMAETICNSLSGLEELYKCMDDLLNLPMTQQVLSQHQNEEWANELLDGSVNLLDICSATRDIMSQIKEHGRDLHSSLRRRKGDLSIESAIAKYTSFRKKTKKDAKRLIAALKKADNKIGDSTLLDLDHHLTAVIRVLREVSTMSITIFQSVLLFFFMPVLKPKPSRWSLVSKLMHKGTIECEEKQGNANELESVDAALCTLFKYGLSQGEQKMPIAQNRLEALEASIEDIENGLECMFRRLIRTRASLLNIVSH